MEFKKSNSAEDLNKRVLATQKKIEEGGSMAREGHFELNKLANNADDFMKEFEEENRNWDKVHFGSNQKSGQEEVIEKIESFPGSNPEIAKLIKDIERDVSLGDFDEKKIEVIMMHTGLGFNAKASYNVMEKEGQIEKPTNIVTKYFSNYDTSETGWGFYRKTNSEDDKYNSISLILRGIGNNVNPDATSATRGGGNFGIVIQNFPKSLSNQQAHKVRTLLERGMEKVIFSGEFESITYQKSEEGSTSLGDVLVRGPIRDGEVELFKKIIQDIIKEYKGSYEHSK